MRRGQRAAHSVMSYGLAAAIAAIFALAFALRQNHDAAPPPERLDAPNASTPAPTQSSLHARPERAA